MILCCCLFNEYRYLTVRPMLWTFPVKVCGWHISLSSIVITPLAEDKNNLQLNTLQYGVYISLNSYASSDYWYSHRQTSTCTTEGVFNLPAFAVHYNYRSKSTLLSFVWFPNVCHFHFLESMVFRLVRFATSSILLDCNLIRHLHMSHNAPCFPQEFWISIVLSDAVCYVQN